MNDTKANLTDVERIKAASRNLRGTLLQSLADPLTGAIADDDTQLSKFHGIYQQDDRDLRSERRKQKLEPAYSFMIRARMPGGGCDSEQWLAMDEIASRYANDSLRVTSRQAFQFHGVIKQDLKTTMQAINASLLDTLAACGDVNRNVMSTSNPERSQVHQHLYDLAGELSEHLTPKSGAYHEIWLDGEKVESTEVEPVYGDTYLPRKFKAAFVLPPENDVDIYSQDLGFIAIPGDGALNGFNVAVGGGMGMSHGEPETYPRMASVIGRCRPDQVLAVAEAVVTTQRDFGDRSNRKHARLKYTIDDRGLNWFRTEVERRLGWALEPAADVLFTSTGDRYGWVQGDDGAWQYTVFVENGRIADTAERPLKTFMREVAQLGLGEFRLTPNQNVVVCGIRNEKKSQMALLLEAHRIEDPETVSLVRRHSMACVGFPTCGLAMAESERYLPRLINKIELLLERYGLGDVPIVVRMTGCPNGCARPYLAEIGLVGKAPGRYNLYLGAGFAGERLNKLYRENIDEATILDALDPLLARFAEERKPGERFGDFLVTQKIVAATTAGKNFHDDV